MLTNPLLFIYGSSWWSLSALRIFIHGYFTLEWNSSADLLSLAKSSKISYLPDPEQFPFDSDGSHAVGS